MEEVTEARLEEMDQLGLALLPCRCSRDSSITSVVVVSDDPTKFLWPGVTIFVQAVAALVLIVAVRCAYHAHVYLSKKDPDHEKGLVGRCGRDGLTMLAFWHC